MLNISVQCSLNLHTTWITRGFFSPPSMSWQRTHIDPMLEVMLHVYVPPVSLEPATFRSLVECFTTSLDYLEPTTFWTMGERYRHTATGDEVLARFCTPSKNYRHRNRTRFGCVWSVQSDAPTTTPLNYIIINCRLIHSSVCVCAYIHTYTQTYQSLVITNQCSAICIQLVHGV